MKTKTQPSDPQAPVIIAYVPVLHDGYIQFALKHPEASSFYVLDETCITLFPHLAKEIRALNPQLIVKGLSSMQLPQKISLLSLDYLNELSENHIPIIAPNEDVMLELVERYLPENVVVFDNIFLRWDKHQSVAQNQVTTDEEVTRKKVQQQFMDEAYRESTRSSDWWRTVGGVVVKDDEIVLTAHNTHLPTPHQVYVDGDPRNNFHKGDHIELSTAIHAEAGLISQAAKKGIALEGADMYVTTFPCPPCAKLVARSGVKTLYFTEGYGVLDGEHVMRDAGIKLVRVLND